MSKDSTADASTAGGTPIQATLAVEPHSDASCVILEEGVSVDVIDQNLTFDFATPEDGLENGKCHTNVAYSEDKHHPGNYVSSDINHHCFCLAFHEIDSIPKIERVEQNKIIVSVLIPNRETLRQLIKRVRDTGANVSVYRITRPDAERDKSIVMDITDITEKQRQALQTAIDAGYYETPRQADLEELSDLLGISKSAVSQRLKAVESSLVRKLVEKSSDS